MFNEEVAASWTDDFTVVCTTELSLIPVGASEAKAIASGDILSEAGTLKLAVADEFDNKATAEITLTREDSQAPQLSVAIDNKNVIAGVTILVQDNQLMFNEEVAASWTDDFTVVCKTEMSLIPVGASEAKAIASGDNLSEAGTMILAVADEFDNKATAEINLTAIAVYGLENLQNIQLQVDQEVNLLEGLTFAEGLTLQKVEIETDGVTSELAVPYMYTPDYPDPINLVFTIIKPDGNAIKERVDALNVKPLDYSVIVLKAADIFNKEYSWFSNLRKATQEYMYWVIFASYDNLARPKNDNRKNVVM